MINGNVPPLHRLRPFRLIAGLLAHWYKQPRTANEAQGSQQLYGLERYIAWQSANPITCNL
jgi:hypothetical protein